MAVIRVIVPMIMLVSMVMMSVCMAAMTAACGIGAALGFKRRMGLDHRQVHGTQHVGQPVVRLDL